MRRLAVIFGILAIIAGTVILTVPWWLGTALSKFGPRFGVTVASYERVGYSRFSVRGVEYRRDPVVVKVSQAEVDTPALWLWRRYTGAPGVVKGGEWSVDATPSNEPGDPNAPRGWLLLQRRLTKVADGLDLWVPHVEAGKGVVRWPGDELTLASAIWKDRTVSSPDLGYRLHAAVRATLRKEGSIDAQVTSLDQSTEVKVHSEGANATGQVTWWGKAVDLTARFNEQDWVPVEARLTAKDLEVAGERVKLGNQYALVRGSGFVEWKDGQVKTDVSVESQPVANTPAPPLAIKLRGHIDNDAFVAESLQVNIPGIEANLSAPVAIDREGRVHSAPSTFTMTADLAQQPWFPARGNIRGTGRISGDETGRLVIDFSTGGENVAAVGIDISKATADGQLIWPTVKVHDGKLITPDGGELAWQGGWNIQTSEIVKASVSGRLARKFFSRWLPEYPNFDTLQIEASAEGPWETAAHSGHANVSEVRWPQTNPLAVKLSWKGHGLAVEEFAAEAGAGETTLRAEGSADRSSLKLTALAFANGTSTRLQLAKPAELQWSPTINLSGLELTGFEGSIAADLIWGQAGNARLRAQNISSEWFRPLLVLPSTAWAVDSLELDGTWDEGPAIFSMKAGVTVHLGKDRAAQFSTEMKGGAEGLDVSALRVAEGGVAIVSAHGRVPAVIRPGAKEKWELAGDAPFTFDAATSANPDFWQELKHLTGVEIVDPEVSLHVDGSLNKPIGEVRLSAARLAPVEEKFKAVWPKVEGLKLHATADKERVNLEQFAFAVEGQAVRVSGRMPLTVDDWRNLTRSPREFAERGEIRVEIPDAEIAAFDHYFPEYMSPKGRFQADLTIQGRKAVVGFIRLQDATSRPLGPLGVLQEINAEIRFNARTANFHAVTARMGGQVVTLRGSAELPLDLPPQLNLTLTGENLPFVRRSGLLVRGDIDLQLLTPASNVPLIRGVVRLRDSLFLADLTSFLPSGTKGVESRPPYFSVEAPPLNAWGVDVKIEGEKFLRLRTPVFNGTATARFRLSGTLGEPRIVGEALVDEGTVRLPFAGFEVQQGEVRLTTEQIEPQLWVSATTRRYGYDLRMEVTGDATSPKLAFSSSPPLEAEQVLLMVMAGEAPSDEVTTTDRQRVARFGAFFGQSLLGTFGGDPTGPDRLTISSGGDISEQGRETYSVEYKLSDRWAVTGEYDEFDDYYGGFKWRIFPKKKET